MAKMGIPSRQEVYRYLKELYLAFCCRYAVYFLGFVVAMMLFQQFFQIGFNFSNSLPGTVYLVVKNQNDISDLKRGDNVAFVWQGEFYARGTKFMKQVAGLPGDTVTKKGREFFINDKSVGLAKDTSLEGKPLEENHFEGMIPMPYFWVKGTHKDSLDSRYEMAGLVGSGQIIGKAYRIF